MGNIPSPPQIPEDIEWTERCPVCKQGKLHQQLRKALFGLIKSKVLVCDRCGSVFAKRGDKFVLADTNDKSNEVWKEYGRQALTKREWKTISYGGMSDRKQMEADIEYWLDELRAGNIPEFPTPASPDIILKKNEKIILNADNIALLEPRSVRATHGTYGGPSFRIAKGVYFRLGAFNAQSESHEELREIDRGSLTLTNKRLIFSGSKRTVSIDIRKIVSVNPYRDAITIRREGRERIQYFTGINLNNIEIKVEDRVYKEPLSGLVIMYLIEGLAKNLE